MPSSASEPGLQTYLREISRVPLLDAQQERDLARRIRDDNDPDARETMIRANLRLVVAVAKRFTRRGLPLGDLIEEGNIGLVRAVEHFDPENGARFSTYSVWWIKQSIQRALINAVQPIHVPAYMVELISRWQRAARDLEERLGRTPSVPELAAAMKLPARKVRHIHSAIRASRRPAQQPARGHDTDARTGIEERLEDRAALPPDQAADLREQVALACDLIDSLDGREAFVLRLRYGLGDEQPLTLRQIGQRLGLTRERIRQIEIESLRKLHRRMHSSRPHSRAADQ